jgi:O-antigen/teichoic acid export membrane protein
MWMTAPPEQSRASGRIPGGLKALLSIAATGLGVQLLTVVSGPVVARMLGPEGRGQLALITTVALIVCAVAVGSLAQAVAHAVASVGGAARDTASHLVPRWALLLLFPAVVTGGIAALLMRHQHDRVLLAVAAALVCYLLATGRLSAALLLGEGNLPRVNVQRTVGMASYVVIIVVCWQMADRAPLWIVLMAYAASLLLGTLLCWIWLKPPTGDTSVRVSGSDVSSFARRGFFSGLGAMDAFGFDQLIVGLILGQSALGLYAVGASLTSVTVIVLTGVASILLPRLAALSAISDAAAVRSVRLWTLGSVALIIPMVLVVQVLLEPALRIFFGHEFVPALGVSRILCVSWAVLAVRRVLTAAAQAQGRVGTTSVVEVASTLALVVGVFLGVHLDGLTGAGWGVLAAAVLSCAWIASVVRWVPLPEGEAQEPVEIDTVDVVEADDDPRPL